MYTHKVVFSKHFIKQQFFIVEPSYLASKLSSEIFLLTPTPRKETDCESVDNISELECIFFLEFENGTWFMKVTS
jgi:hypothetical protein